MSHVSELGNRSSLGALRRPQPGRPLDAMPPVRDPEPEDPALTHRNGEMRNLIPRRCV